MLGSTGTNSSVYFYSTYFIISYVFSYIVSVIYSRLKLYNKNDLGLVPWQLAITFTLI